MLKSHSSRLPLNAFMLSLGVLSLGTSAAMAQGKLGLGRLALPEEVVAWDTDIRPDGQGLPVGSGSVLAGEEIYFDSCGSCHGDFGEAVGRYPALAGGDGSLESNDPVKTIGSYWPYFSTAFDYVRRTMPYGDARSLSDDELYAVSAYVLYLNDLVDEEFVLSNENFAEIKLPNEGGFALDNRETSELPLFSAMACMKDCKSDVHITSRAGALDVTPGAVQ